ncbi:hypothetical protein LUZ61_000113 [Rhynchospora tenuis]|uniref:Glutathione peroxidase n=1 Tax=Rhynchospora tenuis TaxID=198213 RepID=A0AAD5ZEI5_9POAL|nr:hypothetical protein LUZ61_000113 [Rhynchospora tenuis]
MGRGYGSATHQEQAGDMGLSASSPAPIETSIHQFTVKDVRGKEVDLSIYKGKVLLVVNVASKCGFTEVNYTQLTELYNKYKHKDFEILAFPCNQFLAQEPGTSEEVKEFACTRYKAEYPVFQKYQPNCYLLLLLLLLFVLCEHWTFVLDLLHLFSALCIKHN